MPKRKLKNSGRPPVAAHWKKSTLIEEYWIPEHGVRRQSSLFRKNKKFLRDECLLPCWVCGAAKSRANPLEVHHVFEWSLWNAMDPKRVTAILKVLEFYEEGYLARAKNRKKIQDALDAAKGILRTPDDIRNLVVICQDHHRMPGIGVHMISFPIWVALAALKKDGKLTRMDLVRTASQLRRIDEATADILVGKRTNTND